VTFRVVATWQGSQTAAQPQFLRELQEPASAPETDGRSELSAH
jgi:hypothetical protein